MYYEGHCSGVEFISTGLTYYNSNQKQVDVRAKGLTKEYTRKCINKDKNTILIRMISALLSNTSKS